jgi:alpha-1,6-mannosyltransferase
MKNQIYLPFPKSKKLKPVFEVFIFIAFFFVNLWLAQFAQQQEFMPLLLGYVAFFTLYMLVLAKVKEPAQVLQFVLLGVLLRACHLPFFPNLSDDVYRFFWDGQLWCNGLNPLASRPIDFAAQGNFPTGLDQSIYEKLNSKAYYTIYPPLAQLIFWQCAAVAKHLSLFVLFLKSLLLMAEIGTILLLHRLLPAFGHAPKRILIYALNPLVILEITGNAHLEGLLVFFVLLSLWLWHKKRLHAAVLALCAAIGAKLLPLMFVPFLFRRLSWPSPLANHLLLGGLVLLASFVPLFWGAGLMGFSSSLDLYFQRFEFNASLYYLLRWLGQVLSGYNLILFLGPALGLLCLTFIIRYAQKEPHPSLQSLPLAMLAAMSAYLLTSTIVHPWYLCLPLALSLFTSLRFMLVWTLMIILSYSHYQDGVFVEKYGLIAFEYLAVGAGLIWEIPKIKRFLPLQN